MYAAIAVEAPLTTIYHYSIPQKLDGKIQPGSRVIAPFGHRRIRGFCVAITEDCPIDPKKCKDIISSGPEGEIVLESLLELTKWAASYYYSGWGMMLAAAVPSAVRKGQKTETALYAKLAKPEEEIKLAIAFLPKNAAKQEAVLRYLIENAGDKEMIASHLLSATDATHPTLRGLEKKGLVTITEKIFDRDRITLQQETREIILNVEQSTAINRVNTCLDANTFSPFLLYGITGSGKTEVYLRCMTHALSLGKSVLVLVPEISLTPQTLGRFKDRAKDVVAMHSHMSDGERAEAWRKLRRGDVKVVVGARSAIFAPLINLGLIIVDEEHEHTFKQENDPRYHGRDLAVMRAKQENACIILGSATPSLESWLNASNEKYEMLRLTERPGIANPPQTVIVDMKEEYAEQKRVVMFSRRLERELLNCLAHEKQAILFLNRRGFNTNIKCLACGETLKCNSCEISLTYHRGTNLLRCHYCDFSTRPPEECPYCGSRNIRFSGTGTERIEDILSKLAPDARVLRMDSDTMNKRDAHAKALAAFSKNEYDILVGTQMVTKGFDFPNVTLVGVLAADSAIDMPDFRAAERTFQLVTQVVGRAGRADNPGVAVIQAFQPEHYALQYAVDQDYEGFANKELSYRKPLGYPPYGRVARIVGRSDKESELKSYLAEIAQRYKENAPSPMSVLGPSPCPLAKLQDEFRYHILLKGRTHKELSKMLSSAQDIYGKQRSGLKLTIDVDPISLL